LALLHFVALNSIPPELWTVPLDLGCMMQPAEFDLPEEYLLGQFIPLHYHFNMLLDEARMAPFREAIEQVVPAGAKVLELGGGTGVLSYFAAQKADKVYCVERNPALVRAARRFLDANANGERVEVVQADASDYVPPEPVDVVICEMLHTGLLREKQIQVIQAFKERYTARYGSQLPLFIPDAVLLAVQPVEQDFCFSGYCAPIPMFQVTSPENEGTIALAEPGIYSKLFYDRPLSTELKCDGLVDIERPGRLNALRFITRNFLAFLLSERRTVEWMMHHLILPLERPIEVEAGDAVRISFDYHAGDPIEALSASIDARVEVRSSTFRRAA
jgi:predicted RNA methylase